MSSTPFDDLSDTEEAQEQDSQSGSSRGHGSDSDEMTRLREENRGLFERLARLTAEFKNAQKRMQGEFDQRMQYANSSLIKSLLPVIDNFARALAVDQTKPDSPKADAATILKGMQIVHDQWLAVLKQQQVEEIAPKPGEPFDPTLHEAIMQQESTYKEPTVVQLLQKGYSLHGRTLRPAGVAVSKSVS